MIRLPHERFMGYIIARYGVSQLGSYITNNGLQAPDADYRRHLTQLYPSTIKSQYEDYGTKFGLLSIFKDTNEVREAKRILSSSDRPFIEQLLLAGVDSVSVHAAVRSERGRTINPASIDEFKYYFWDTSILTRPELIAFLRRHFLSIEQESSKFENALENNDNAPPPDNGYWAALDGKESLFNFLGLPFDVKSGEAFQEVFNLAYVNLLRLRRDLSTDRTKALTANAWMQVMRSAHEARESNQALILRVVEALKTFLLKGHASGFEQLDRIVTEEAERND